MNMNLGDIVIYHDHYVGDCPAIVVKIIDEMRVSLKVFVNGPSGFLSSTRDLNESEIG